MNESKCVICGCMFRGSGSKCESCARLYPSAEDLESAKKKVKNPEEKANEDMIINLISRKVYEILEEAGIKRYACETCGSLFFRKSPAQKYCNDCKASEEK